jgi:drug/metabolite transporter (DMT)-like permease
MKDAHRGALEMVVAMTISGSVGWLVVSSGQTVEELLFWRCAFGALMLLAFCAALGLLRLLSWRLLAIAAVGGVAIVTNWWLLFNAYSHASISIATIIYNTQPFMLAALAALFLRERFTASNLAWLALAFGGVVLIARAKSSHLPPGAVYGLGVALALGAAFFYAVAALVAKQLKGIPPQVIALVQMTVGALVLLPIALRSGLPAGLKAWGAFAAIGIVYTGLVLILLYGAFQKLSTAAAGGLSFTYPLVAVVIDYVAFDVHLGLSQWIGGAAIVLSAVALNSGFDGKALLRPFGIGKSADKRPNAPAVSRY